MLNMPAPICIQKVYDKWKLDLQLYNKHVSLKNILHCDKMLWTFEVSFKILRASCYVQKEKSQSNTMYLMKTDSLHFSCTLITWRAFLPSITCFIYILFLSFLSATNTLIYMFQWTDMQQQQTSRKMCQLINTVRFLN